MGASGRQAMFLQMVVQGSRQFLSLGSTIAWDLRVCFQLPEGEEEGGEENTHFWKPPA